MTRKAKTKYSILVSAVACLFLFPIRALATDVSGSITNDATWSLAGSPYILTSTVTVWDNATLTIEPGVEVDCAGWKIQADSSTSTLDYGRLVANGASFTGSGQYLLYVYDMYARGSSISLTDCTLEGGTYAVVCSDASLTMSGCTVTGCSYGVSLSGDDVAANCISNCFEDISLYGIDNSSTNVVDARYCWWGDPSGPTHASNLAGTGVPVSDNVRFDPWVGDYVKILPGSPWAMVGQDEQQQCVSNQTVVLRFTIESHSNISAVVWVNIAPSFDHGTNAIVAFLSMEIDLIEGQNAIEIPWLVGTNAVPANYDVIASVRLQSDTDIVLDTTGPGVNDPDFSEAAWITNGNAIAVYNVILPEFPDYLQIAYFGAPDNAPYINDCMIVSGCSILSYWEFAKYEGIGPFGRLIDAGDESVYSEQDDRYTVPMWVYDQLATAMNFDRVDTNGLTVLEGQNGMIDFCNNSPCGNHYSFSSFAYSYQPSYTNVTWEICKSELDAGRPFIMVIDTTNAPVHFNAHAFPCFGYQDIPEASNILIRGLRYNDPQTIEFNEYSDKKMSIITLIPGGYTPEEPPDNVNGVWSSTNGADEIVHWPAISNALLYRVYQSADSSKYGYVAVGVSDAPSTVFTNIGAASNQFFYKVTAEDNAFLESGPSNAGNSEDTDGDGLADSWESSVLQTLYWTGSDNPDNDSWNNLTEMNQGSDPVVNPVNNDLDGDTFSNYEEAICGTDPYIGSDLFECVIGGGTNNAPVISWNTLLGRKYTLRTCTELLSADWDDLPGWSDVDGTGLPLSYTNQNQVLDCEFYKIIVTLP